MNCGASNVPPGTRTIEEDTERIIHKVVHLRKRCPKKCSQLISKKLKMEHFMLENTKIVLKDTHQDDEESENDTEELVHCNVDYSSLLNKMAALEEEADNTLKVLVQIKSERTCPVNIVCGI